MLHVILRYPCITTQKYAQPQHTPPEQDAEASQKRSNAASFGNNATSATRDVSDAVARFSGEHVRGCGDLKRFLAEAEMAAKAASGGLSAAAAAALKEVRGDGRLQGV